MPHGALSLRTGSVLLGADAEVSRRTLFNYFDGKMEAVLGLPPAGVLPLLEEFCAGGLTGDLYDDACIVGRQLLKEKGMARDDLATLHLALERNPKLLAATATTFRGVGEDLLVLIAEDRTEQLALSAGRDTLLRTRAAAFDNLFEALASHGVPDVVAARVMAGAPSWMSRRDPAACSRYFSSGS